MAVKLSGDQEKVVKDVLAEADKFGASPMERLAAIETIGVEANYKNVNYGDRDSLGAFQQRTPWGSAESRLNVSESARRFFERARAARQAGQFKNAGDLAQKVQVSAFGGRYHQKRGEAKQILAQFDGGGGGGSSSGGSGLAAALSGPGSEFESGRGQVSSMPLMTQPAPQAPAGTAPAAPLQPQVAMPAGYGAAPLSGSPGELRPAAPETDPSLPDYSLDTSQDAQQAQQAQQEATAAGAGGSDSSSSNEAVGGAGAKPVVKIAAGANVAGKPIVKPLLNLLDTISSEAGFPITVGTGTNHSYLTTSGNVSEHSTGHGADVPATGKTLTDQATDALLVVGRGKKIQWLRNDGRVTTTRVTAANARKIVEAGGIFNIPHGDNGRVQLIANTHQGGDHTNHWHLGLREG